MVYLCAQKQKLTIMFEAIIFLVLVYNVIIYFNQPEEEIQ